MATRTRTAPKVQQPTTSPEPASAPVSLERKAPSAAERLRQVLSLIGRETAKPVDSDDQVKWGKAIGLLGGGSVYINRGNADVRSSSKQVALWAKELPKSSVRGPQGQYLRITF